MTQLTPAQQNSMARQAILSSARKVTQQIQTGNIVPAQNNIITIQPRYTGLLLGFFVELIVTVVNAAGTALTLTNFNAMNVLSNITFTDLNNNQRINTTGWHLYQVGTAKMNRVFGSSIPTDSPIKYGSNYPVISAAGIAASATGTVKMVYWVPLTYTMHDLRGSIYTNVTSATATLALTINPAATFSVAAGADPTLAVYQGNGVTLSNVNYTISQVYYSQLPTDSNGAAVLPLNDMATVYELKSTALTGMSAGQDFPYLYSNYRTFQSTTVVYDNGGVLNPGSDVNYWALQSASYTNLWKVDPTIAALWMRQKFGTDTPAGMVYFDHRDAPLNIQQYGNLELILNPVTAAAGAQLLVGTEAFALTNQVTQAGSLNAG